LTFRERLRALRIAQGITLVAASRQAGVASRSWSRWEAGSTTPKLWRCGAIARALNVPVAALFTDELVVAEIVVSAETVARIRKEGRSAAAETAQRLAQQLEPAIYDAATRKPVDTRAGARAKPRKTRAERLAELKARPKRQAPKSIE
jgi:transcriptional regulator with XRE-family HTH domain